MDKAEALTAVAAKMWIWSNGPPSVQRRRPGILGYIVHKLEGSLWVHIPRTASRDALKLTLVHDWRNTSPLPVQPLIDSGSPTSQSLGQGSQNHRVLLPQTPLGPLLL